MLKIIPKTKSREEGVNLNSLKGGSIFLHQGILYIKDEHECSGVDLSRGRYNDELNNATVTEVNATLSWQKKPPKKKK